LASDAGRHRRRKAAVSFAGMDRPPVRRQPSGFDDDAGACWLERQGQGGTWLATGASILALGILRDRPTRHGATARRLSAHAGSQHQRQQHPGSPPIGRILFGELRDHVVLFSVYFVYAARREENNMIAQFPEQYPAYRRRTRMLLPLVL